MPPNFTTTTRSGIHVPTAANIGTDFATGLLQMANEADSANMIRSFKNVAIPGSESRTNVAYGLMPTPDRVQSLVLPTNGLIVIAYQAIASSSVSSAGKAAIFIGANQLKVGSLGGVPVVQEVTVGFTAGIASQLFTGGAGLLNSGGSGGAGAEVTTGQLIGEGTIAGGLAVAFAAAGTYDISVQTKSTSGSVTLSGRHLWAWTAF